MITIEELNELETRMYQDAFGRRWAVMFHYHNADPRKVAEDLGYDTHVIRFIDDVDEYSTAYKKWKDGDDSYLKDWNPRMPSPWFLGYLVDDEGGGIAMFLRTKENT